MVAWAQVVAVEPMRSGQLGHTLKVNSTAFVEESIRCGYERKDESEKGDGRRRREVSMNDKD